MNSFSSFYPFQTDYKFPTEILCTHALDNGKKYETDTIVDDAVMRFKFSNYLMTCVTAVIFLIPSITGNQRS